MTTDSRPVLGVLASPGTGGRVRPLLLALAAQADVRAFRAGLPVDAVLATAPAALAGRVVGDIPLALWLDSGAELAASAEIPHRVRVALSSRAEVVDALGDHAVLVPARGVEADRHLPVPIHVRRRQRQLLGLADDLVVTLSGGGDLTRSAGSTTRLVSAAMSLALDHTASTSVTGDAVSSTDETLARLAVTAAAVVDGPHLGFALALGTPTVTTALAAEALGARHDRDVVVVTNAAEAGGAAKALATDERRAARLGAAGRRLVERHLDLGAVAARVGWRLGLVVLPTTSADLLSRRLDELGTAIGAPIRDRATSMVDALATTGAESAPLRAEQ